MRDRNDFDAFYAATSGKLIGQVYAMTGDLSEAEDAVQEAYIRAWQRWPRISGYDNPEAWLRTVAFRITVNSWRKAKNRLVAHHRSNRRTDQPGPTPDLLALTSALRRIPAAQRRVIVLHYLADLSVDEIALETGAPTGTVKSWLARGRRALSPLVDEFDDDESRAAAPAARRPRTARTREPAPGDAARPDPDFHHIRPDWETTHHV